MIFDLHCDTIDRLINSKDRLKKNNFSVDVEKLKKSNANAQIFALYVSLQLEEDPLKKCLKMIDRFYSEIELNKEDIKLATNYDEFIKNKNENKISAFLSVEEGGTLQGNLYNLRILNKLGVRVMTLTWNIENEIGYPNINHDYIEKGLKKFGFEVVSEMNRLGMIIDISHLSDKGVKDVLNYSKAPVIASHSNARAICNHKRNLTDEMIKGIAKNGGVIGINFEKTFLSDKDVGTVEYIVNHIKHIINVGGENCVGIGSDFDGISTKNLEMQNVGEIYKLIDGLKKANFTEDVIEKIMYKNALRLVKDVMI